MGFDNECILNIQSLPGEYFCPVCRTLIYPNEALQSQCTHLYCKPCLAYVVASTRACPYDGYLVTEADSKPLIDSNKSLAETIGKVAVNCLYHRSGCQWQGGLSECIAHCTECSFGNSPVLCNRCGAQIMHRQVQEHGQTCLGVQPQAQQVETQAQASTGQGQAAAQDQSLAASAAPASAPATVAVSTATPTTAVAAPASVPATVSATSSQGQSQGNAIAYPQTMAQAPTAEQWYHQQQLQYQQYYQQYPGYPYQQQYQQYVQYQQQSHPQYPPSQVAPQQVIQGQQQPQPYMVPQPPIQHQAQAQAQAQQPLLHQQHPPQSQPQPHPHHPHVQHAQMQAQLQLPVQQPHPQAQPQGHPPPHAQVAAQQPVQPHTQPHHPQPQLQQAQPLQLQAVPQHQQALAPQQHPHPQMSQPQPQPQQQLQPLPLQAAPQHQQHAPPQQHPHPQMQHPQPHPQLLPHQTHAYPHPHPQPQLQQHHIQLQLQPQSQLHTQPQPQLQPQPQSIPQQLQHSSAHAVSGHQSYPQPQSIQQIPPSAPPQHPMHTNHHQQGMPHQHPQHPVQTQNQVPPQQLAQMRPLHTQSPMQLAPQGPHPQQQAHHQVVQPAQQIQQHPGMQPQLQQHGLHPGQPQQQGPLPSQHLMQPQHSVRSQAPLYMQQHVPVQPSSLQKVASVQNLPGHQVISMPQQPSQQSPGGPAVLLQLNQQSSTQRYPVKGTSMAMPSEPQPGSMLHSQHTYSGSQGSLTPASPAPQSGVVARQIPAALATSESVSLDKLLDSTSENAAYVPVLEAGMVLKKGDGTEASDLTHTQVEGSESAELKLRKHGFDSNSEGNESEEITISAVTGRNVQPNADCKDVVHAKTESGEEPVLKPVKKEEASESPNEGPRSSNGLKASEGNNGVQSPEVEPHGKLGAQVEGENLNLPDGTGTVKSLPDSNNIVKLDFPGSPLEKTNQCLVSHGLDGNATSNIMHTPQHSRQHVPPANERSFPQSGHNGRNLSQFPQQGLSIDDLRRMRAPGSVPGHERYPAQHGHHPTMPDPAMISHRPPAPNEMFPQNMHHHGPSQERMFQEPSRQVQVHGQGLTPSHMRPMVPNFPEPYHRQPPVSEQFQPPMGQQPYGPHRSEPPHAGLQGPVPPTLSARVPGPTGLVQKGFDKQAMSEGQSQNHIPPSHAGGARFFQEGPMARPGTGGPPPGPSGMLVRGPLLGPEDHSGWTHPSTVEADAHAVRRPNFFDGRQHEPRHHVPGEHASVGQSHIQPNPMVINGAPGKVLVGGMPDSGSSQGLAGERFRLMPEGRFKPLTEEGFKALQSDQFRPSPLNSVSHTGNQLWFEDLKQFPQPGHLDGEGAPRFDGPRGPHPLVPDSIPRPLDRVPRGSDGGAGVLPPRLLPPYQSSFPFPSGGSAPHSVGIGERQWPGGSHEDLGRTHDLDATHPDFLRPVREFGHHPIIDSLLPLRSPGREQARLPPNQFRSGSQPHKEDFHSGEPRGLGERIKGFNVSSGSVGSGFHENSFPIPPTSAMPGYLRKGDTDGSGDMRMSEQQSVSGLIGPRRMDMNGPENLPNYLRRGELHGHGLSTNSQGGEFGSQNLPHHLRVGESLVLVPSHESEPTGYGGFQSQLRRDPAGPGNLPSHLRTEEQIGGGGSYPKHGFPNESGFYSSVESLDYLRMRKPGSTGWCRICKLDCETVEGLDLHSQTREHQKMAMDLVMSIKRESNKRPKLSSEGNVPREDGNKIKLSIFESSVNRH